MTEPPTSPLCPGCFAGPKALGRCPQCGFDASAPRPPTALSPGTLLHEQFIIGRVLGKPGGFGITYLAFDRHLEARVAVKEYLPRQLAARGTDGSTILPHGVDEAETFRDGLSRFVTEARTLAKLDHPNIVRVRQFFEANGSAYLVMDYYQGRTLAEYLDHQPGGRMAEDKALALMLPILDGLRAVHAKGFLHRDIKPANIYLAQTEAGGVRPILLDFGAARQAIAERSRSMSVVLTEGYAPFEQYHRRGKQGAWTDVYAAAAVLYRMLTGEAPPEANGRMADDDLRPPSRFGVSQPVSDALDRALALNADQRVPTAQALQALLAPPPPPPPPPPPSRRLPRLFIAATLIVAVAGAIGLGLYLTDQSERQRPAEEQARQPKVPGTVFRDNLADGGQGPEMVVVPAGRFRMGSGNGDSDEKPVHLVRISRDFAVGKYEVTVGEFRAFVRATGYTTDVENGDGCHIAWPGSPVYKPADASWRKPGFAQGAAHPVTCVSWNDAMAFVEWLSEQSAQAYRLPTEAEWEYAARGGSTTAYWWGDERPVCRAGARNGAKFHDDGVCARSRTEQIDRHSDGDRGAPNIGGPYRATQDDMLREGFAGTEPVGSYSANAFGLYDTAGNVWEWVEDWYQRKAYAGHAAVDPIVRRGDSRANRGGSWGSYLGSLSSASRYSGEPHIGRFDVGFRLARDL